MTTPGVAPAGTTPTIEFRKHLDTARFHTNAAIDIYKPGADHPHKPAYAGGQAREAAAALRTALELPVHGPLVQNSHAALKQISRGALLLDVPVGSGGFHIPVGHVTAGAGIRRLEEGLRLLNDPDNQLAYAIRFKEAGAQA